METTIARTLYRTLEPCHAMIYFVPEARAAFEPRGLDSRPLSYFASRAAPLGRVDSDGARSTRR